MTKSIFISFAADPKAVRTFAVLSFLFTLVCFQTATAQMVRNTEYQADQSLKSNARVNPSTLAMELSISLAGYKGRADNGLPVSFNYSSKAWQIKAFSAFENHQGIITDTRPMFGLKTAAGWMSNLASPQIDFFPARYEGFRQGSQYEGTPYELSPIGSTLDDPLYYIKRVHVIMPGGSSVEFRVDDTVRDCGTMQSMCTPDLTGTYLSVDGSRMRLEVTGQSKVLLLPDGSRYLFGQNDSVATTHIDAHGNQMTYNIANRRWTDTLGRVIDDPLEPNISDITQNQTVEDQEINLPGIDTNTVDVTLSWRHLKDPTDPTGSGMSGLEDPANTALHSLSNTGCNGNGYSTVTGPYLFTSPETHLARVCQPGTANGLDWTQGPPFNPIVLTRITLENGQFYEFKYNVYGEITKIVYPTGGYERFAYGHIPSLQGNEDTYSQANRGVTNRWVSVKGDGTDEVQWTYGVTALSGDPYKVTITAPNNSRTVQYLHREPITPPVAYGFIWERTGRSYEDRVYAAGTPGPLMRRNFTKYVSTGAQTGGYTGATRDLRVEKQVSIIFEPGETNALAQLVETVYETPGQNGAPSDPAYFAAQNAKQSKVYHYVAVSANTAADDATDIDDALGWFSGATAATVSEMDYLYDANYLARNISGLVTETRVKDSSGNTKAKSQIVYDEAGYALSSSGTMPTAAANSWIDLTDSIQLGATIGSKRGLPTTVRSYSDLAVNANLSIETHSFYDQYGNLRMTRDGRGSDSEIQYSAAFAFAYPTKTISAVPGGNGSTEAFETTVDYDFNTGLPTSTTDANNLETRMEYIDPLLRPTKVSAYSGNQPVGAATITEYGAGTSALTRFIKVKTQIDEVRWKEGYTFYDGLGKTVKSQSVDANGDVFALTCYDQYGRVEKVSNPFRNVSNPTCSSSLEWTTTTYDAAGRAWKVTTPDNAVVETNYSLAATTGYELGTVVTVTDQASKQRRSLTNALGQLKRVDEPDVNNSNHLGPIIAPYQPTNYSYDILNNLTTVVQGAQTRTFVYDSLSRLKQATNPESGLIQYGYDNNGNLTTKTDARGVITTYSYDALNRVSTRSYANEPTTQTATPTVTYTYDNLPNAKGKLTKVSSIVSETRYTSFDVLGRVTASEQRIPFSDTETAADATPRVSTYTYNLSGALIEQTYPSGRVVKNVLDNNGDLEAVESKKNANYGFWNYAQNFTYTAAGAVSSMQLGNFRWESTQFNSRLQPTQIALGTVKYTPQTIDAATNILKLDYTYNTISNGTPNADNNGNVLSQTITVPTVGSDPGFTAVQTYSYDSLNRLKVAAENLTPNGGTSVQTWKQTFTYDRYGNRNFDEVNTTTLPKECNSNTEVCAADRKALNPAINTSDNRLSTSDGYTFDNSGNTTRDANSRKFTYDGENKQIKVETVDTNGNVTGLLGEYWYDGDGKRVKKDSFENNEWITTIFVYDASGKLVEEYSTKVETTNAKVSYLTNDHLGSPRITTDRDGQTISRRDFQPFGEEIATSQRTQGLGYTDDAVRQKFTLYERDIETDLDFAQARMYANRLGRFTTVDPIKMTDDRMIDPQQINLYIYTRNNPLNFIDPTGMIVDFEKDNKGNLTKKGKNSKEHYEAYVAEVEKLAAKDPQKYGSLLDTITKLKDSEVIYIIKVDTKSSSDTSEGFLSTDGENIFVNIRNLGNNNEKFNMNSRFAHELEHARQFEDGELSFNKDSKGNWGPSNTYDIYDEVKAFKEQLKLSPDVKDTALLKSLRRSGIDLDMANRLRNV